MAFWNAFVLRVIPSPTAPNSVILTLWGRTSFMFICLQIELLHTVHVLLLNNASTKSTSSSCKRNVSPSPSVRSILIAENNIDFYKTMNRAVHMASSTATREGSFFFGVWGVGGGGGEYRDIDQLNTHQYHEITELWKTEWKFSNWWVQNLVRWATFIEKMKI